MVARGDGCNFANKERIHILFTPGKTNLRQTIYASLKGNIPETSDHSLPEQNLVGYLVIFELF